MPQRLPEKNDTPPTGRGPNRPPATGAFVSVGGAVMAQVQATAVERRSEAAQREGIYEEGLVAGVLGAAAIALWFLVLDTVSGRPFFTPTILGTAIFRSGEGVASAGAVTSSSRWRTSAPRSSATKRSSGCATTC